MDEKKNRDFTFDYSFWSHDEFETDENGLVFTQYIIILYEENDNLLKLL